MRSDWSAPFAGSPAHTCTASFPRRQMISSFFLLCAWAGVVMPFCAYMSFSQYSRSSARFTRTSPKRRQSITQAKVGNIPARVWRQRPMMSSKALCGRSNQRVNFATFHEDGSATYKFKSMARSFGYIFRLPVVIAISGPELLVGLRHGCSPGRGKKRVPFFAAQGNRKRLDASPQSIRPCSSQDGLNLRRMLEQPG